jgi:hypothetical protein
VKLHSVTFLSCVYVCVCWGGVSRYMGRVPRTTHVVLPVAHEGEQRRCRYPGQKRGKVAEREE